MTIRAAYARRLAEGLIVADPGQARGLEALARLEADLNTRGEPSFLSALFKKPKAPKGVYLWGPVGRGKSLLMDLFFAEAPEARKARVHFHAFMAEVHDLIRAWRDGGPAERRARFGAHRGDDPIAPAAAVIADKARLLCFDELQVTDIADAMILGRLFDALFEEGVTMVATSNRAPETLYHNGINRQLFEPFIALIQERLDVVEVAGGTDWRLDRLRRSQVYFAPATATRRTAFEDLWKDQIGEAGETGATLEVTGRKLRLPRASGRLLRVTFAELCRAALGPRDYLAIATAFDTVFLEDVPVMTAAQRNEAKRFVTLVDALYEAGVKLVVLAEAEPDALFPAGDGAFEFERTASRLQEMRSAAYLEASGD